MNIYFEIVKDEYRKHLNAEIQLPQAATQGAMAYDFYSPVDIIIPPLENRMIWTDVKGIYPKGIALIINVRSSMGKHPVMLANTQGWIDSDYANNTENDGNIGIILFNLNKNVPYIIKAGDRIGQGMFIPYLLADKGNSDKKRDGGYGSTGR